MGRPRKPDAATGAERIKAWRATQKANGAKETTILLEPENARHAEAWVQQDGTSISGLINALIQAEAKRRS